MSQKYIFTTDKHALHTLGGYWTCGVMILLQEREQPFCLAVGANAAIAESRAARIAALLNEGWTK